MNVAVLWICIVLMPIRSQIRCSMAMPVRIWNSGAGIPEQEIRKPVFRIQIRIHLDPDLIENAYPDINKIGYLC
jgi:hypothetical protein